MRIHCSTREELVAEGAEHDTARDPGKDHADPERREEPAEGVVVRDYDQRVQDEKRDRDQPSMDRVQHVWRNMCAVTF